MKFTQVTIKILLGLSFFATYACAMEREKAQIVQVQTNDNEVFKLPWVLAQKFVTLKHLLEDFDSREIRSQKIPMPMSLETLSIVLHLVALASKDTFTASELEEVISIYRLENLVQIASALNYLDGPRQALIAVLRVIAQRVNAIKFDPGVSSVCNYLERTLVPDLSALLNDIFLLKLGNIQSLARVIHNFNVPAIDAKRSYIGFNATGRYMFLRQAHSLTLYNFSGSAIMRMREFEAVADDCFSPDGKFLAVISKNKVLLIELEKDKVIELEKDKIRSEDLAFSRLAFSEDSTVLHVNDKCFNLDLAIVESLKFPVDSSRKKRPLAVIEGQEQNALKTSLTGLIPESDIAIVCPQLPIHKGQALFVDRYKHFLVVVWGPNFYLFDISHIQKIVQLHCRKDCVDFEIKQKDSLLLLSCPEEVVFINLMNLEVRIFSKGQGTLTSSLLSDSCSSKSVLTRIPGATVKNLYVPSIGQFSTLRLPVRNLNFRRAWFAPFDDEYVIHEDFEGNALQIKICRIPFSLLRKLSLLQIIMLIRAVKDPLVMQDQSFDWKSLLNGDVNDLYFSFNAQHPEMALDEFGCANED